jgi:hypothetical protein
MTRRLVFLLVAMWSVIVAICIWEWNVMGRCPNWTHDHHTEPGAGWLLAACFVATWAAVWLGGRR